MSWSLSKEAALRVLVRNGSDYSDTLARLSDASDAEADQMLACVPGDGPDVLLLDVT